MGTLNFEETHASGAVAAKLIAELDVDLALRNPGVDIAGLDVAKFEAAEGVFVIAWDDDEAVGCGALVPLESELAEIKRVYVPPAFRGRGVSRALLNYLLDAARMRHIQAVRLGTGKGQVEALNLYRSAGFREIPHFGSYVGDDNAVCLEKHL